MNKKTWLTLVLVFVIILSFSLAIYANLLKEKSVKEKLENMEYYEYSLNEVSNLLLEELPSGELKNIYASYLTLDQIKIDINTLLNTYFTGETDKIKENFKLNLRNNFTEEELTSENINELIDDLTNTYYNNIFPIKEFNNLFYKLPYVEDAKLLSFLLMIILIVSIFLIKEKNVVVIYLSFISSGLILVLPKIYLLFDNFMINFYYYNMSLSFFIKNYFYKVINDYFIFGLILFILGLVGFTILYFRKTRKD